MNPGLLLDILKPGFLLHHAVYGSLVVGLVCPLVGVYLLLRRLVFWGVALPQVAAAGISFAFLLQGLGLTLLAGSEAGERHLAILGSVLFTAAAVLALVLLERRGGHPEGRLGALYAGAAALAILFTAGNAQGEIEMLGLLKGEIVAISEADFHAMLAVFGLVAAGFIVFQREFLLVSYDRDMAATLGRRVLLWDALLYGLIALTISLGVMTVGPLVIFGFLVLPPMAALPWARGMLSLSGLACAVGALSALAGFLASYAYDLPLGPAAVCAAAAALLASDILRRLVRARIQPNPRPDP
ncbi:MAG: metal ABC transporter permease [Elusimicrobia bacterium]|nr:metal ABC transporter permease [Elusimicrobiota bacterium]